MPRYDAIIVGGGHNGLVCGAYLAKAGFKVCVLERREVLGGAAATEGLWPGYRVNTAAHMLGLLQPRIIRDLELRDFGYEVLATPPTLHVLEDVGPVAVWGDTERMAREIARFSPRDAEAYRAYVARLSGLGPLFRRLLWEIPFTPSDLSLRGLIDKAAFALRNRGLLRHARDVSDLMSMSAYDYLARWFETDAVRTLLGYYPAAGAGQSVSIHSPGTAMFLMRAYIREPDPAAGGTGLVKGGMGAVPEAIAASGARFGLEVRTGAAVERILVEKERAQGVLLAGGEELRARVVVANAAIQRVFASLVETSAVPADYRQEATSLRGQATTFKVHLAVEGRPALAPEHALAKMEGPSQITVAPSLAYLETAYTDMRGGALSRAPYMTIQIPTVVDPSLAPEGHHILSIYGGHLPKAEQSEDLQALREAVYERALATVERYLPGIGASVRHKQVLLPADYETDFGLPGGSPHHFDMTADQLFFRRPVYGYAGYDTPVGGLFLCGASTHPGGGVTGVPGYNAARVVGAALRKQR